VNNAKGIMNENLNPSDLRLETRRDFLRKSATAAAAVAATGFLRAPVYGQATAPSANVLGANSKLTLGFVGCGAQGQNAHIRGILENMKANNVEPVAVCDVSKYRVAEAQKLIADAGAKAEGYELYQKLLERKDIDAVVCATVDHWHAKVGCDTLNSGKAVYVEKPMSRYLGEAFELHDTAKKTGKVLQIGSQGTSDAKWHKAAEWIKGGKIGPVVMLQGSYMRNSPKGEWNYAIFPWAKADDINWAVWHGDQIKTHKEFNVDDYFRWRKYYPYCAGLLGDLLPHKLHPYLLASAATEFPSRVCCIGSDKFQSDKGTAGTPPRDCAEIIQVTAEFPNGMTLNMTCSSVNETGTQEMIRGAKANLYMAGNKVELKPEKPYADEVDPETSDPFPPESIPLHHKNWFDAIRGVVPQPNANADLAIRVQTIISLAEMSNRLNTMCLFDEKTRKVTDGAGKELPLLTYGSLPKS
jgi:predicted dehydrogenase